MIPLPQNAKAPLKYMLVSKRPSPAARVSGPTRRAWKRRMVMAERAR